MIQIGPAMGNLSTFSFSGRPAHKVSDDLKPAILADAISCIGTDQFEDMFSNAVIGLLMADHMTLIRFQENAKPEPLIVGSRIGTESLIKLTDQYSNRYYKVDPNFPVIMSCKNRNYLHVLCRKTVDYDRSYRRRFFASSNVSEKMSLYWGQESGRIAINCYAERKEDFLIYKNTQEFRQYAILLVSIANRHYRFDDIFDNYQTADHQILVSSIEKTSNVVLTPRERQICQGILEGRSAEAIGLELGIATSSVITFRKRLYRKLEICSQAELFSLALFSVYRK